MDEKKIYRGMCNGGPLGGTMAESRFPSGFLYVLKQQNQCWLYKWNPEDHSFNVGSERPMEVDLEGRKRAANEPYYDVVAGPRGEV